MAVGSFKRCGEVGPISVKGHPQELQPLNAMGSFVHQKPNGIPIAQSSTRMNGVLGVATGVVFWSSHRRDAPLGPATGGTASGVAVQQQHP